MKEVTKEHSLFSPLAICMYVFLCHCVLLQQSQYTERCFWKVSMLGVFSHFSSNIFFKDKMRWEYLICDFFYSGYMEEYHCAVCFHAPVKWRFQNKTAAVLEDQVNCLFRKYYVVLFLFVCCCFFPESCPQPFHFPSCSLKHSKKKHHSKDDGISCFWTEQISASHYDCYWSWNRGIWRHKQHSNSSRYCTSE